METTKLQQLKQQAQNLADEIAKLEGCNKPTLQELIASMPEINFHMAEIAILNEREFKIKLPNCNHEWTFTVWDWVQLFCKTYPGWCPIHGDYAHLDPSYLHVRKFL